jgi:thiamine kinase
MAQKVPAADPAGVIPSEVLLHVPGCETGDIPFSVTPLSGGMVNRTYVTRTRRGRYVVRMHNAAGLQLGVDRQREFALQQAAASVGVAPPVIYAAPSGEFMITEFIDGRLWSPDYFLRIRDLRAVAQRLRTLHTAALPSLRRFDPLATAKSYAARIETAAPNERAQLMILLGRADEAAHNSHTAKREPTLVHNDLNHSNLLTADRLYMIDWEYAEIGDPLLDLACILAYYPKATTHALTMIESAGLRSRGATPLMLAELAWLFELLNYFWYRLRRQLLAVSDEDRRHEGVLLNRLLKAN